MSDFKPEFRDGIGYCSRDKCPVWPCHEQGAGGKMYAICIPWVRSLRDSQETAWDLIAHAHGGNWALASEAWKKEAQRWRDAYHGGPPGEGTGQSSNVEASDEPPIAEKRVQSIKEVAEKFGLFEEWFRRFHERDSSTAAVAAEWLKLIKPKGTPMSADNVIYVQKRSFNTHIQELLASEWCVWLDSVSNESPQPNKTIRAHSQTRAIALQSAHDFAMLVSPSHGVQELAPVIDPPTKTQAQQDAEWLREHADSLQGNFGKSLEPTRLKEIAERLEST